MIFPLAIFALSTLYALIAWRNLRHGLIFLAAALPVYLLRFDLGAIPMTLLEMFALILVATWLIRTIPLGLKPRGLLPTGWPLPIALLLAAATVSVFVAPDMLSALGIWKAYFVEPILVFLVAADLLRRHPEDRDRLFVALGAGGLFVALVAIVQSLTLWGIPAPWDVEGRVVSIFPYPNAVGLYLAPVIVMGVMKSWSGGVAEWRKKFFWLATTILSSIAIVLSQSEAAIVAVVATLLVAGLMSKRSRLVSVALVILVVLVALVTPPLRAKLTFNDFSGQVRRSQWSETAAMLNDRALLGAGLNGYPTAMEPYHKAEQYEIFQYPHTIVLNIWTELGLLGLIAFALLALQTAKTFHHSTTPSLHDSITPAFLALLAMTIHGLADVPYFKNDLAMMTWLLLAVVATASYAKIHGKQV